MTSTAPTTLPVDTEQGEHDRFCHIIIETQGRPFRALCGKEVWGNPHDSQGYPLCPSCAEICRSKGWAVPS